MKPNGTVHPAAELFPMLGAREMRELADDISTNGLRHAIILLPDGTLLDGRNRLAACELVGVKPTFTIYHGDNPIGVVMSENVKRRHLTEGQKGMLAVDLLPLYEQEAEKRMLAGVANPPADRQEGSRREREAVSQAAADVGTSGRTVARSKRVATDAPDLAAKVRAGELAVDRAERELKKREQQKRENERQAEAEAQSALTFDLRVGDFRDVLEDLADDSVDLILTDPPYGEGANDLYWHLGEFASRKLKPGGSLVAYCGQATLGDVLDRLSDNLRYWWTLALTHSSGPQQLPGKWVMVRWKPIVWFVKGHRDGRRYVDDVVTGSPPRKDLHEWAQGVDEVKPLIERLTEAGGLIVDPFAGSGSFGHAANDLGRHFIGADTPDRRAT